MHANLIFKVYVFKFFFMSIFCQDEFQDNLDYDWNLFWSHGIRIYRCCEIHIHASPADGLCRVLNRLALSYVVIFMQIPQSHVLSALQAAAPI